MKLNHKFFYWIGSFIILASSPSNAASKYVCEYQICTVDEAISCHKKVWAVDFDKALAKQEAEKRARAAAGSNDTIFFNGCNIAYGKCGTSPMDHFCDAMTAGDIHRCDSWCVRRGCYGGTWEERDFDQCSKMNGAFAADSCNCY